MKHAATASCFLVVMIAFVACATIETSKPPIDGSTVLQILHRSARDEAGRLSRLATTQLSDRAITEWTGTALPLDGWRELLASNEDQTITVWAPHGGPLADSIAERLELLFEVVMTAQPVANMKLAVFRPGYDGSSLVDFPLGMLGDDRIPVFVDLIQPAVGERSWNADCILIGEPPATRFLTEYILAARASGQTPDLDSIARPLRVDPERIEVFRLAIP